MGEMAELDEAKAAEAEYFWEYFCERKKNWTTKDGQILKPQQMTKTRRQNVIKLVAYRYFYGDTQEAINTVKFLRKMDKLNKQETIKNE